MNLPSSVFGRWLHFHEEDYEDIEVYRPSSEDFPRSRGRRGFEIQPNGDFIHLDIGRGDAGTETTGQWELVAENRLRVTLENGNSYLLNLQEISSDELHIIQEYGDRD